MGLPSLLIRLTSSSKILFGGVCVYSVYHTLTCETADFYYVDGCSMEPILSVGDIVWVRPVGTGHSLTEVLNLFGVRGALTYQDIKVGDVVVAVHPVEARQRVIKRVVGLAGARVPEVYRQRERLVPVGRVWLEGDRSSDSLDSRHYGAVPLGLLTGKVEGKICPLQTLSSTLPSSLASTQTS